MSRLLHIKVSLALVCALALLSASCGGSDADTTAPSAPVASAGTEPVTGQMAPGGLVMHQFFASATGAVSVTLTTTDPPATLVGLGIGIPGANAGTCDLTKTVQARPGTAAQLTATVETGTYCAGTFDVGGLGTRGVLVTYGGPSMTALSTISKTMAVAALALLASACGGGDSATSTTAPTVATGPVSTLFEGKLAVGGSAFYSFTVSQTGNANVMLASVTTTTSPGSESNVVLGLALGTPLGTDCTITSSLPASASLQSPLVNSLTPGIYCARVYDIGNLRSPVNFAIRIVHT